MAEKSQNTKPTVHKGTTSPGNINPRLSERKGTKENLEVHDYLEGIRRGDRMLLSRAITLVESKLKKHQKLAQSIIEGSLPFSGNAFRIGITGSPGVGKSSFIEAMGQYIIRQDRKLAVLAIDPSSQISHGSILGDKTRMGVLANKKQAYIRPSPAGDSLGGVARKTRETIILCEAAGYDTILIETVGVGQSEIAAHSMVDFFLLLLLPGAGDELQGIKRGIVEMADLIAVNKADGERKRLAQKARQAYQNALHLFPAKDSQWTPKAVTSSAIESEGMEQIWKLMLEYREATKKTGYFEQRRSEQATYWLNDTIDRKLKQIFNQSPTVKETQHNIHKLVTEGNMSPFQGAEILLHKFIADRKNP